MIGRKSSITFFLFIINILFADKFLFGDYYLEGRLDSITKKNVYFTINEKKFYLPLYKLKSLSIDTNFSIQNLNTINIIMNDGVSVQGKFVNINNYNLTLIKNNRIIYIPYSQVTDIKFHFIDSTNYKEYSLSNEDVVLNLYKVLSKNKIDYIDIKFDDENFYEKIWDYFCLYLSKKKIKMLWDLIDIYYDKEILLKISENEVLKTFNINKISIRREFFDRLLRIVTN